ncbi:unnamed protein product [Arctogadus glacialis]
MIIQANSPLIQSQEQVSAGGVGRPTVKASLDEGGPHMVGVTGDRGGLWRSMWETGLRPSLTVAQRTKVTEHVDHKPPQQSRDTTRQMEIRRLQLVPTAGLCVGVAWASVSGSPLEPALSGQLAGGLQDTPAPQPQASNRDDQCRLGKVSGDVVNNFLTSLSCALAERASKETLSDESVSRARRLGDCA